MRLKITSLVLGLSVAMGAYAATATSVASGSSGEAQDIKHIKYDQRYYWDRFFFGPSGSQIKNASQTTNGVSTAVTNILNSMQNPEAWSKAGAHWYFCELLTESLNPFCRPITSEVVVNGQSPNSRQKFTQMVSQSSAENLFKVPSSSESDPNAVDFIKSVLKIPSTQNQQNELAEPSVSTIYTVLTGIAAFNGQLNRSTESSMSLLKDEIMNPYEQDYPAGLQNAGVDQLNRMMVKSSAIRNSMGYFRLKQNEYIQVLLSLILSYQLRQSEKQTQQLQATKANTRALNKIATLLQEQIRFEKSQVAPKKNTGVTLDAGEVIN